MNLTKREALEKHKELWLTVAEMSRTEKRCVSKHEALLKMGVDPDTVNSECFCCEYADQENKKLSRNNVCDYCPVKWPGITNVCTFSFFGEWRKALGNANYEKAAEIAEKIAHLADEPLKELDKMEKKFTKSDLTGKETDMPEFDVMEVRRPGSAATCPWKNKGREMHTVFVREEVKKLTVAEISKLLGMT